MYTYTREVSYVDNIYSYRCVFIINRLSHLMQKIIGIFSGGIVLEEDTKGKFIYLVDFLPVFIEKQITLCLFSCTPRHLLKGIYCQRKEFASWEKMGLKSAVNDLGLASATNLTQHHQQLGVAVVYWRDKKFQV